MPVIPRERPPRLGIATPREASGDPRTLRAFSGGSRWDGPDIAAGTGNPRAASPEHPQIGVVARRSRPHKPTAPRRPGVVRCSYRVGWISCGGPQKDMRHLGQTSRYERGPCPLPVCRAYGAAVGSDDRAGEVVRFPRRYVGGELWESWVDEQALARHFSVSTRTVRRWRAAGMPSLLVGSQRRYRISLAERWHLEQGGTT